MPKHQHVKGGNSEVRNVSLMWGKVEGPGSHPQQHLFTRLGAGREAPGENNDAAHDDDKVSGERCIMDEGMGDGDDVLKFNHEKGKGAVLRGR